jgi:hypothetical protein
VSAILVSVVSTGYSGIVVHTCNPCYSGGRDRVSRVQGLPGKVSKNLSQKQNTEEGGGRGRKRKERNTCSKVSAQRYTGLAEDIQLNTNNCIKCDTLQQAWAFAPSLHFPLS